MFRRPTVLQPNNLALCCHYVKDSNAKDFWQVLYTVLVRKIALVNAFMGNEYNVTGGERRMGKEIIKSRRHDNFGFA